ncbi:hypothetical protein KIW84_011631 [Lathyrus oleraceus]|uniref:Calponin-homology (CH) domain-containing protein n=1 Tax=Pisum sativum TaxID=3888 RepID=A0A9D5GVG0_PEA|nr:hypothetical protein KIW84_011631 [Pisum sativum]
MESRKSEEAALRRYEVAGWLRKMVGIVAAKDLPAEPSEKEFRLGVRSGIILCNVINKVQPGVVCKEIGIPIFEASDLEQGEKSLRIGNGVLALKSYSEWNKLGLMMCGNLVEHQMLVVSIAIVPWKLVAQKVEGCILHPGTMDFEILANSLDGVTMELVTFGLQILSTSPRLLVIIPSRISPSPLNHNRIRSRPQTGMFCQPASISQAHKS